MRPGRPSRGREAHAGWSLLHLERLLGHTSDAIREAAALIQLDPNYPPTYAELGLAYEANRETAKALEAYDTYVLLAPNFADSNGVRANAVVICSW